MEICFTGLGGYLLTKSSAMLRRNEDKDVYDLVFVLLNNTCGGPAQAATEFVSTIEPAVLGRYERDLRAAMTSIADPNEPHAETYAAEVTATGDPTDTDQLAQDAIGAATAFLRKFEELRPQG